jgi:type II secretory pathway component PulF
MSDNAIAFTIRRAAARFKGSRADYYHYLALMLESTKGGTKISTIFDNDAQRYEGKPRGALSAYWSQTYQSKGANLADAWQGTLPDDEVTIIRVAQTASDGALIPALHDISRIAKLSDRVKTEVVWTLSAGIVGITVALLMLTVFPVYSAGLLQERYAFLPLSEWGPLGKSLLAHAERVKSYGIYVVLFIVALLSGFSWSINNLIGPVRDWLDTHVVVYRTIRDIKGAMFLATMSTLTRKRGNVMYTATASLSTLVQSARSPWLKWRVQEILDRIEHSGMRGSEAFKTKILSNEMYYFLNDTQAAIGYSEGFDETGKYVENKILGNIIKSMSIFRWVLLLTAVFAVAGMMGWQLSVVFEMGRAVQTYYTSR